MGRSLCSKHRQEKVTISDLERSRPQHYRGREKRKIEEGRLFVLLGTQNELMVKWKKIKILVLNKKN